MNVKAVPDGFHTVTPYLIVRDAARAIEFYQQAFGAKELYRLADPGGKIMHAEMQLGDSPIMLADESPEWGNNGPLSPGGGTSQVVHLYVDDVDAVVDRAVAAGARVMYPVRDQFYGDRGGRITDPFGHAWSIATHKEDLTPAEIQRRFEAFMQQMGSAD